ncbi:MAG: cysteine desulfurase [Bacilli bacterium]
MINAKKIREDFPMYKNVPTMSNQPLVYFDNAATTFKPQQVIDAADEYYRFFCANSHRGDYELAHTVDVKYEEARARVAKFINAETNEVAFTSGASMSLNSIAYGLAPMLEEGDEILLSEAEHASNVLPWFSVADQRRAKVTYIPLTKEGRITVENFKKAITPHTKIVSLAQVTNVLGYVVDIKTLAKIAHEHGCLFVVDAAQSVPHMKVDVKDLDCDFLAFSGHKMLGPTGIGVMFGKYELLKKMKPLMSGGGMSSRFDTCGDIAYKIPPIKFEAGTQNLSGALGLAAACDYLDSIGMDNIREHETKLRKMMIDGLKKIGNVTVYNEGAESGIVTFNINNVFAQDAASYLSYKGIAVRSGNHCAQILLSFLGTDATVRASLYLYNTEEDVRQFVEACASCGEGGNFLDAFFN